MNKKWLLGIILVPTVIAITFISIYNFRSRYKKYIIDEAKWKEIISNKNESTGIKIEKIKFDDYSLLIDEENSKIYYSAINKSQKYNPRVVLKASNDSIKFSVKEEITQDLVSKNHSFDVLIYDENNYRTYSLVVTNLPIVNIQYNSERTEKIQMELSVFDNNPAAFQKNFTSKGTLTITEEGENKKNYAFSLKSESLGHNQRENNVSIFGMEKHSEYVLNALEEDNDRTRSIFATNLWSTLETRKTDRYRYVEVFVNNEYKGLYALGYNIEKEALHLGPEEFLFYKNSFADSEKTTSEDKLDGYTLFDNKMDRVRKKEPLNNCIGENCKKTNAWEELSSFYEVLNSENTDKIKELYNEKNAIDTYLYYLFIQASNNVGKDTFQNTYLIFRQNKNTYKVEYKPWNVKYVLGHTEKDLVVADNNSYIMKQNPIARLIELKDEDTIKAVKEEYENLRKTRWSDKEIDSMITSYEKELFNSGAYLREQDLYEIEDPVKNLNTFKEYVTNRLKAMDDYIANL